jgi:hypothetical protein
LFHDADTIAYHCEKQAVFPAGRDELPLQTLWGKTLDPRPLAAKMICSTTKT